MKNHYPTSYVKALAELIRRGEVQNFIHLRYPYVQEAEPFVFEHEDFTNINLTGFSATHNFCYVGCDFRQATLGAGDSSMWVEKQGSKGNVAGGLGLTSIAFIECNMSEVDLTNLRAASCIFHRCNLNNAKWSEHTRLGWADSALSCLLSEVTLSSDFRAFLEKQSAKFVSLGSGEIIRNYDVSENYIFDPKNTADLQELLKRYPE